MSLGNWLRGQIVDESTTIVKTAKSKGPAGKSVAITVADIQRGTVQDADGTPIDTAVNTIKDIIIKLFKQGEK